MSAPFTCKHPPGYNGSFDESARRLSHQELAAAKLLVSEGHHVSSVAEGHGRAAKGTRSPDLLACGVSVEVKAFSLLHERGGRSPRAERVANKLLDAAGQGSLGLIWGLGSGLSKAVASEGYKLFCEVALGKGLGKIRGVRIVGDDFDIAANPLADLRVARQAMAHRPVPARRVSQSARI